MNQKMMTQKKAINLVFNIGSDLIKDLADEKKLNMSLAEYGELVLKRHKELYSFVKSKKEV